ncbi:hypothetical protein HGRIS_006878 [Hohenbuehelia grisea]|uniref:Histone-lysine N-methyltransferase SET5 n=1 Tax=Hohenbuehelia grisea TaxID=104357 RepID=A0ABR3JBW4_9AGAR
MVPSEEELTSALVELKSKNPSMGIPKIHALLLASFPDWAVSEKRTRKILQIQGLVAGSAPAPARDASGLTYPTSRLIKDIDLHRWTEKVTVRYFDKRKGKGLVAAEKINKGELIWKEDPFILAPEWEIYDLQVKSAACGFCSTPFRDSPLVTSCPAMASSSSSASTSSHPCTIKFCSRLCVARSAKHHALVCAAQNPASVPLLRYARDTQWMALHALAQCTSRVLLANQIDEDTLASDWQVVRGLAELGMEERFKHSAQVDGGAEPDRVAWEKAHTLFVQAFDTPKSTQEQKKLARILKKPLREEIRRDFFEYDAFLRGLGRMSLNLEAHGGLYTLHAHLNHSCTPNVSIRHLDMRTALARITVLAKADIEPGEELFVTYVDPSLNVRQRRAQLAAWGFGECRCKRCVEEARALESTAPKASKVDGAPAVPADPNAGMDMFDLEQELKAGLGVM